MKIFIDEAVNFNPTKEQLKIMKSVKKYHCITAGFRTKNNWLKILKDK